MTFISRKLSEQCISLPLKSQHLHNRDWRCSILHVYQNYLYHQYNGMSKSLEAKIFMSLILIIKMIGIGIIIMQPFLGCHFACLQTSV